MLIDKSYPWYRKRGYYHFDEPIGVKKALSLVSTPRNVASHSFFPLISYEVSSQKARKDPVSGKIVFDKKVRPISYASHLDSHIYSYYSEKISEMYECHLKKYDLGGSVLAFRSLGKNNAEFAGEAFSEIQAFGGSVGVMAFDVSGFFDNLNHALLKKIGAP